jgi:GxxExxY protein
MEALHTDVSDSILRCAIAVHRELGPGLAEHSYQRAMTLEMTAQGLLFKADRPIVVRYRGVVVGWHRPDFIVDNKVVVEIKVATAFDSAHSRQVLNYLKLTNLKVALLLNFGVSSLGNVGIKRFQM